MKNQQVLSLDIDGNTITSRTFDFEAFCIINENHIKGLKGKPSLCKDALVYLFEGTAATEEVLNRCEPWKLAALCNTLWEFYFDSLDKSMRSPEEKN